MAVTFLKKGKDAKQALAREEKKAEDRQKNHVRRFWLPTGKETKLTFLDGKLDADGVLDIPMFYEHQLFLNGSWQNWYACTADNEPCPICESGDTPSLVGVMSVIDHSEYTDKQGKVWKDQLRLFVAKRGTLKMLQKMATKRGGLEGCTFEVGRVGDKAPSVGDVFEFVDKKLLPEVLNKYKAKGAVKYDEVLSYHTADELREMGFGGKVVGNEGKKPASTGSAPEEEIDYNEKL